MLRARTFWEQRPLHPVVRLLLLLAVAVLLCIAIGFIVASGKFTRFDFLALAFYLGLSAFAWHPLTAAFIVMLICSVGVMFTGSGGDLLELAIALCLVAATCVPWVVVSHAVLLGVLTTYIAVYETTLTQGGVFGVVGIAVIALFVGLAFRLVAAREMTLLAERERAVKDIESIARESQERIADELHDGIAHDLTLVLFHARALPRQPDDAARQVSLATIEHSAEQALHSIQSLLSLMRDPTSESRESRSTRYGGNLVTAVMALGNLLEDAGISTQVGVPSAPHRVGPTNEQILIETAIEAITNIIKHAPKSQSASIDIRENDDDVELVVTNVAPSAPTRHASSVGGRGLHRVRQRLSQNNGQLEADKTADGWTLRATVPTITRPAN